MAAIVGSDNDYVTCCATITNRTIWLDALLILFMIHDLAERLKSPRQTF